MKKILVPTDFSKEAENAIKAAATLARNNNCELILLHIIDSHNNTFTDSGTPSNLPEAMYFMKLAHQKFEVVLGKSYLQDITVHEMIAFQSVPKGIMEASKKYDIDLIIMGSQDSKNSKKLFMGTTAKKVVKASEAPVLVVKNEYKNFHINDFVFASEFSENNKDTYKKAVNIAQLFGSKIHLLMVNTSGNFMTTASAKVRIMDFIKDVDFDNYTINIYNDETAEKGILNFAQILNADLIGISTQGKEGISKFFNGSLSGDLVSRSQRPVITFRI